jgi:hypothetical protein
MTLSNVLGIIAGDHLTGSTLLRGFRDKLTSAGFWPNLGEHSCWLTYTAVGYRNKWQANNG